MKKTFTPGDDANPGDAIRISNVASPSAEPNFDLDDLHCFQYVCEKHNDGDDDDNKFADVGSTEEDNYVKEHYDSWSEYLFTPAAMVDGTKRGFYISNLITDTQSYFRFYAFWCYKGYSGTSLPEVKQNQLNEVDFLNSDALFAQTVHNVIAYDSPIRFIFYHAHAMLDVRLDLPDYEPGHKQSGSGDTTPERLPSGYKQDDVRLVLTNVKTAYRVAWASQSSSSIEVETELMDDAERVDEIPMHRYHVEEGYEGKGHLEQDSADAESESSYYRTYGFCAIVPKQEMPTDPATGTDLPLLRLYVKNPITDEQETYVYTPGSGGLALTQGTISVLHLRLSRTANDQLTVMGHIEEWDRASGSREALKDEGQDKAAAKR